MKNINNLLTSGHDFSDNENLQKFRFGLLNFMMVVVAILTITNLLISFLGIIDFGGLFEKGVLIFLIANIFAVYLLRKDKSYYYIVALFFIISSLSLFYFVLLTRQEDEFRLIAFFLALFSTYVLLGRRYGTFLAPLIVLSIFILSHNFDLRISAYAYSTFYTFFIIFTGFLHLFLHKVERDAIEFELLNNELKRRVQQETVQRMDQEQMLLRQCRMANMGEMLDSIAHQWRQPLMHINSILLNMENALEVKEAQQQGKVYLEKKIDEIETITTHMSQTIEDFRGLFKLEKEFTCFSLQVLLDDVLALIKNNLNDIELECSNEGSVSVLSHRSELMQVIIIVLSNSVEVLKLRNVNNKKISIGINRNEEGVVITIEDNAGGINLENKEVIFDPYFTTKEQSGGTGLGLYVARIIVEHNMDGKIVACNTKLGAKFTISSIGEVC